MLIFNALLKKRPWSVTMRAIDDRRSMHMISSATRSFLFLAASFATFATAACSSSSSSDTGAAGRRGGRRLRAARAVVLRTRPAPAETSQALPAAWAPRARRRSWQEPEDQRAAVSVARAVLVARAPEQAAPRDRSRPAMPARSPARTRYPQARQSARALRSTGGKIAPRPRLNRFSTMESGKTTTTDKAFGPKVRTSAASADGGATGQTPVAPAACKRSPCP